MEVLNVLTKFEEDARWFDMSYEELKKRFNEEWVAVFDRQVVDHDPELDKLMERLEAKFPKDFRNMVVEFVTKKKVEMIL